MDKKIAIMLLLLLLIANLSAINMAVAQTTTVYVDPPSTTIEEIGEVFDTNVSISQVTDLAAWQFKLYYESTVLNATSITEGPFLKSAGATTSLVIFNFTDSYNTTHGRIWVACSLIGSGPGANGNGTLVTITFKAIGPGSANLRLADTDLLDSQMPPARIPHASQDGQVLVETTNIAITDVKTSKTIIGKGWPLHINVTVANLGFHTETFNVTVYANATAIQNKTIILPDQTQAAILFTWYTGGFVYGNYTVWAYAEPIEGETDTADNTLIGATVLVTIPGDVNGDKKVRVDDVLAIALAFGSNYGDPRYKPNLDVNSDGKIRVDDVLIAALNFGQGPW